jgi:diguanylate cyclase
MDTRPADSASLPSNPQPEGSHAWPLRRLALGSALAALGGAVLAAALGAWAGLGAQWPVIAGIGAMVAGLAAASAVLVVARKQQAAEPTPEAVAVPVPVAAHSVVPALDEALHDANTEPVPLANLPDAPTDIRDSLTGAFTQRYFIAAADREWSRIRRHGEDAALLMIDADRLGAINQDHGRSCGDAVLVHLTRLVNATLRQYDLMARFNAGVLVVYLPQTDPIGAIDVAERIRERVANFRMNWPTGPVTVTVSVGVASIGADHAALDTVIGDAGAALREAKLAGRNCVRAAPVPPKRSPANGAAMGDGRTH